MDFPLAFTLLVSHEAVGLTLTLLFVFSLLASESHVDIVRLNLRYICAPSPYR